MERRRHPIKLTADRLREVVAYDPISGVFTSRVNRYSISPGDVLGTPMKKGYLQITVDGESHYAHRLAVLYKTCSWPNGQVDHRDGVKTNNSWINLRDGSASINRQNIRKPYANNPLGVLGVHLSANGEKFISQLKIGRRIKYLGTFETIDEASAAYVMAKRTHHEGCTL